MSEPRRRSTRLVGTPKVNYEEKPVELPSSLKKRRDSSDHSGGEHRDEDSKRFKKAKLRHDDDEDTILDDEFESVRKLKLIKNEKVNSKTNCAGSDDEAAIEPDDDETGDSGQRYFLNDSIEELKENHRNSQNTSDRKKAVVLDDSSDCLVDEHGFLIPDADETNNPPSSPLDNQNILDVTDYDQLDESTIVSQTELDVGLDERPASDDKTAAVDEQKPRRKKFVKKHKPKRCSIELGNLVKHSNATLDSQATIIIKRSDDPESKEPSPNRSPKAKKEMKTSFVEFFKSQNISKSPATEQPNDEVQVVEPVKRGRGRPRKHPSAQAKAVTPKSTVSNQPAKRPPPPEVLIEADNDCEMVEIVSKTPAGKSDALLDDKNNGSKTCLSSIDDNTIIVLDKGDEDSSTARSDDPWTIKYRPVRADQVLDNRQASEKLKNWIQNFSQNIESGKGRYSDDEDEERYESCVLVTGPTGCGKTAMTYAIAEELNYKVFEINCSSRRNSRFINQIKEATLSHTVTRQGDSSSSNLFGSISKSASKSSSKNAPIDNKQKTLFSFFQKKSAPDVQTPLIDESSFSQETVSNLKALSINSNSLILFDDVDVIFEEDGGFWQALSSLIENTKRPIILTATSQIANIRQEIRTALNVRMNHPTCSAVADRLKEIVLSECNEANDASISIEHARQIETIAKDNLGDIRSCLNRLQFDFSSVNVSKSSPTVEDQAASPVPDNLPDPNEEQQKETIDLQAYHNLILSDLLSSSNFQTNSRNELDNSCTREETYQSQDRRESILDEFNRLNSLRTIDAPLASQTACSLRLRTKSDSSWSDGFEQCISEVEERLVLVSEDSSLYSDYLPYLSSIMISEQARLELFIEHTRRARRFLHYLDLNSFHLSDFVKLFLKDNYLNSSEIKRSRSSSKEPLPM